MRVLPDQMFFVRAFDEVAAVAAVDNPDLGPSREGLRRVGGADAEDQGRDAELAQFRHALHSRSYGLSDHRLFEKERFGGETIPAVVRAKGTYGEEGREPHGQGDNDYAYGKHGN